MSKLTEKTHWDGVHLGESQRMSRTRESARASAVNTFKRLLGPKVIQRISGYDDYLLWDVVLPKYVPRMNGAKALEIGSAPGEYIVQFSKNHGCEPHGLEYSEIGVEVNRRVFDKHGFNPDNVIHADFFSDEFANRYNGQFDVVVSKGFIEHFEDVPAVIDRHTNLLKPGGYLIVTVPNLRGGNKILAQLLDETAIPRHNLKIMTKDAYTALFQRKDLQQLFCGYYGTFSFYLFTAGNHALQRRILKAAYKVQPALNVLFRTMLGNKGAEGPAFSPFLMYIGRKL
jgi:2-polyprenyl-3-methyl-5-hydroxy-6-metoxy-1,4-benzoquinol methylase